MVKTIVLLNILWKPWFLFFLNDDPLIKEQNKMCICYLLIITELDNRNGPICEQIIIGRTDSLKTIVHILFCSLIKATL